MGGSVISDAAEFDLDGPTLRSAREARIRYRLCTCSRSSSKLKFGTLARGLHS